MVKNLMQQFNYLKYVLRLYKMQHIMVEHLSHKTVNQNQFAYNRHKTIHGSSVFLPIADGQAGCFCVIILLSCGNCFD